MHNSNPNDEEQVGPKFLVTPKEIAAKGLKSVGGKAYNLSLLSSQGFPVPEFLTVLHPPKTESDWQEIFLWWDNTAKGKKLAVRSSAQGEDASGFSFAGQMQSFLNIDSHARCREAVSACFDSHNRPASQAYQEHFSQDAHHMNVILQVMVNAKFSGVYFTVDPVTGDKKSIIEVVAGFGEALVSGQKTPFRFIDGVWDRQHPVDPNFPAKALDDVRKNAQGAELALGYAIDMEWATDENGVFWLLQARPITTNIEQGEENSLEQEKILKELKRLQEKYRGDVIWDGQTFAEFIGFPSYFTFSIWKQAFAPEGAFNAALKETGYAGFHKKLYGPKDSLLERIFGRAYINLSLLNPLFFGEIPFRTVIEPRPKLKFDYRLITLKSTIMSPLLWFNMLKLSLKFQFSRKKFLRDAAAKLQEFRGTLPLKPWDHEEYESWPDDYLYKKLAEEVSDFANKHLIWPFMVIFYIEFTLQELQQILGSAFSKDEASKLVNKWMGRGLATVTAKMNDDYHIACDRLEKRHDFFMRYGHRGPGEMDLINPRWVELGDKAFYKSPVHGKLAPVEKPAFNILEDLQGKLSTLKQTIVSQRWQALKEMLELREQWKMLYMRPYANIRWLIQEIGRRVKLEDDIFWLRYSEVLALAEDPGGEKLDILKGKISDRKPRFKAFRKLSFPVVVSLDQLTKALNNTNAHGKDDTYEGLGISPGIAYGKVIRISDPANVDFAQWPSNPIIVAEATDPGWTPLFQKAKGFIVERGGMLSHCAIVAREMNLPAVSGILGCMRNLKDGENICVDGSSGRVTIV